MGVALGAHRDVDQRVARQLLQHVVEEADAGLHVVAAGAVEIDGDGDSRLGGLAVKSSALRIAIVLKGSAALTGAQRCHCPLTKRLMRGRLAPRLHEPLAPNLDSAAAKHRAAGARALHERPASVR